jgi:hypothetical protein
MAKRHQPVSRVADTGHARVADDGDVIAAFQMHHHFGRAGQFIVLVVAERGLLDAVMIQQLGSLPRVLAGDQVHFLQGAQSAQRNVFQIADGCSHQVQRSRRSGIAFSIGSRILHCLYHEPV